MPLIAHPDIPATATIAAGPQKLSGAVAAQPSKNYTARRLLAAALADGESTLTNLATSDDAQAMMRGLRALGTGIDYQPPARLGEGGTARIRGVGGRPRLVNPGEPVNVGNAGAVLRLLLAVGALLPKVTFITDHPESLGKRPNADLLRSLEQLGCMTESTGPDGRLPITLRGGKLHGGHVTINGARSSQYLSGLLYLAPLVGERLAIKVAEELVSKPAVRQTLEILADSGVKIEAASDLRSFIVEPQRYCPISRSLNGDWPGSAALLAAAAVTGSEVTLTGLYDDNQGERLSAEILRRMGVDVQLCAPEAEGNPPALVLRGPAALQGQEFDGDPMTDAVLALIGASALAAGRTRIHNVSNLRIKECDRITEPLEELRKLGVRCWEGKEIGDSDPDAIIIDGNPDGYEGGIEVDGRGDHRVIMMLSVVGLRCRRGLTIRGAHHVAKSYPAFFQHLAALGARVEYSAS